MNRLPPKWHWPHGPRFGLGANDNTIGIVNADGVALAAIQGLNQKLEETRSENAELKVRFERLERLLNQNARSNH